MPQSIDHLLILAHSFSDKDSNAPEYGIAVQVDPGYSSAFNSNENSSGRTYTKSKESKIFIS